MEIKEINIYFWISSKKVESPMVQSTHNIFYYSIPYFQINQKTIKHSNECASISNHTIAKLLFNTIVYKFTSELLSNKQKKLWTYQVD